MNAGAQTPRGSAQARVLAFDAWLEKRTCLLDGDTVQRSPRHGDLGKPEACRALEVSTDALAASADGRIDAVTHDLHPDFESTRLALAWSEQLGVLAIAVQHHHARIAVVPAELGSRDAVIGLALGGVGLGSDSSAWSRELLHVAGARCERLAHLPSLALPDGDVAVRVAGLAVRQPVGVSGGDAGSALGQARVAAQQRAPGTLDSCFHPNPAKEAFTCA